MSRMREDLRQRVQAAVRDIPDFPAPGIVFKDITPVLADPGLMSEVLLEMTRPFLAERITHVVAIESRGFIFGMPIALQLGAAFVPARKPGKLPWKTASEAYVLEYREDVLEMHIDAVSEGARVLIVDDVLATGGTAAAAVRLSERLGGAVAGVTVLSELTFLHGRERLDGLRVHAVVEY